MIEGIICGIVLLYVFVLMLAGGDFGLALSVTLLTVGSFIGSIMLFVLLLLAVDYIFTCLGLNPCSLYSITLTILLTAISMSLIMRRIP
jgi:hypothetical protein